MLACYPPSVYTKNKQISEEYLYLQSVQSVCFMEELTPENKVQVKWVSGPVSEGDLQVTKQSKPAGKWKLLHYTITDGVGNKRYLSSLIFNEVWSLQGRSVDPQDAK